MFTNIMVVNVAPQQKDTRDIVGYLYADLM
jgi:hypothetical protein